MTVFIQSVTIKGIMGIPNEMSLDLTAPLTLIYAPNGTGKTSTWNAVRALMSMGVNTTIECEAPNSLPAEVRANLLIGGKQYTATAADGKLMLSDVSGGSFGGTEALTMLTPELDTSGLQTKGGVLKDRLVSQIEGCRFLPSDSLLYLIDSGAKSTELRRKLFADLTGTSTIQAEIRETTRYRDLLKNELSVCNRELAQVEEQARELALKHNPDSSDPLHLILKAAALAGVVQLDNSSPRESLSNLRKEQAREMAELDASRSALSTIRSIERTYQTLDADAAMAAEEAKKAISARELAQEELRAALAHPAGDVVAARKAHERFRQQLARIASILAAEGRTSGITHSSLQMLRESAGLFTSEAAIESRIDALARLDMQRSKYRAQMKEREQALEKKRELLAQAKSSSRETNSKLAKKVAELDSLTKQMTQLSQLATSIRASARTVVAASQSSSCPCCSHQWESVDALLSAIGIQAGSDAGSAHFKRQVDGLRTDIDRLQAEKTSAEILEAQLRDQETRISALNAWIDEYQRLADGSEIAYARLSSQDSLPELQELRSQLSVWRLLLAIDELGLELDEAVTADAILDELSTIGESLRAAVAMAEQGESERELRIKREQSNSALYIQVAEEWEKRLAALERIKHQRDEARAMLQARGISLSGQPEEELRLLSSRVEALGNLIMQASAAVEASVAISASERISANLEALKMRRDRLVRELELTDRLIDLLADSETKAAQKFFNQLGPAVGTLFDHMQVNRVFRTLSIRTVQESFCLSGQLDDGVSLDPAQHFSQGQRQDLALSMFLVRAASLGGTFFLDEPLVHLDDLNRTALLDCLRACVLGTRTSPRAVNLIVTTANWTVARHLMQKFYSVANPGNVPLLRVIQLSGNVGSKVEQSVIFPLEPAGEHGVQMH